MRRGLWIAGGAAFEQMKWSFRRQQLALHHRYVYELQIGLLLLLCASCCAEFERPTRRSVQQFVSALEERGIPVSLRNTRGLEAAAACGQLRNQHQKTPLAEFAVPA